MPKVLLADDSTHAQRMGTKILTGEGIEVVSVSNGEAAVKKLSAAEFDVVFADVFMPGRTGYEVCTFVKNNPKFSHIPVVLVVGQLEPFDPDQAKKVGADAVLKKPFEATEVVKTAKAMLELAEERKPPPPPPPPTPEELAELAARDAEESKAMEELTASLPQQAARMEVPEDMQHQAAFDLYAESPSAPSSPAPAAPAAAPAPPQAPAAEAQPASAYGVEAAVAPPAPAAVAESHPASVYGVETAAAPEQPPPVIEYGGVPAPPIIPEGVPMPELVPPEIQTEPELAAPAPEPAPPARVRHWVAEPEAATDMDRAAFPAPAATAVAEAAPAPVAAAAPAPAAADWADLLKSVEEPAPVSAPPAPAPAPAAAAPEPQVEAIAFAPAPEPAPAITAVELEPVPAASAPAPETVAVAAPPEPVAAPAAQAAGPAPDIATVRAAVEAAFDKVLPSLKPVQGLLDTVAEEILRRLGKAS